MPHVKELTDEEINEIGKQSGVDPDIIRSWYKGKFYFLFLKLFIHYERKSNTRYLSYIFGNRLVFNRKKEYHYKRLSSYFLFLIYPWIL